jgi:hypothetical protein
MVSKDSEYPRDALRDRLFQAWPAVLLDRPIMLDWMTLE